MNTLTHLTGDLRMSPRSTAATAARAAAPVSARTPSSTSDAEPTNGGRAHDHFAPVSPMKYPKNLDAYLRRRENTLMKSEGYSLRQGFPDLVWLDGQSVSRAGVLRHIRERAIRIVSFAKS